MVGGADGTAFTRVACLGVVPARVVDGSNFDDCTTVSSARVGFGVVVVVIVDTVVVFEAIVLVV